MIRRKFLAGSSTSLISATGSPSTNRRSAKAPSSTTPEFPYVRAAQPGQCEQCSIVRGRHLEDRCGRIPTNHLGQHLDLFRRILCTEEDVGPPRSLDLVF